MSVSRWNPSDRPRERLLQLGENSLTDAELIAVILGCGHQGLDVVAFARSLLTEFRNVRALLTADIGQLRSVTGLGGAKIARLKAITALWGRYERDEMVVRDNISDSATTLRFLQARMGGHSHEVFACLFLDARHRLLAYEELFHGSVDRATVYPRQLVKRALHHNAAAVVLAHNHPSGVPEPSSSDISLTERLRGVLKEIDVRLLDHVIVGHYREVSLAERGLI